MRLYNCLSAEAARTAKGVKEKCVRREKSGPALGQNGHINCCFVVTIVSLPTADGDGGVDSKVSGAQQFTVNITTNFFLIIKAFSTGTHQCFHQFPDKFL